MKPETEKELRELFEDALKAKQWIAPQWEPYAKCAEEEREMFVFLLNLFGKIAPKSLGCIDIRFEKCSPYRTFQRYDTKLGHNPEFLDTIIEKAIGPEKTEPIKPKSCGQGACESKFIPKKETNSSS